MTRGFWIGTAMAAGFAVLAMATPARAGYPECGNIRLEEVKRCEIKADISCMAGCSELGIYKTACATRLHRSCRNECTVNPMAMCTDSCTVRCEADCKAGINVICVHNCFGECVGSCDASCANAADPAQCRATCEATCDGECDIKCAPVINASCYQHCVECCGGSCTAQANMTCQQVCQDREFEDCEHEFRANCQASCMADGALFCDGRYIMSGKDLPGCLQALANRGVMVEAKASGTITLDGSGANSSVGCAVGGPGSASAGVFGLLALGLVLRRRRR